LGSTNFGIGVITDILLLVPVFKERLNSLVTTGVILAAVALSVQAEILAFVTSRD